MTPEELKELQLGTPVTVTILRGGYWKGLLQGRYLGLTPTGLVVVSSYKGNRAYNPENVRKGR